MRTCRRKYVPGVEMRWRKCHHTLRSASVAAARKLRARRWCGSTTARSRFAQTRGSSSAEHVVASLLRPPPPPPPHKGEGSRPSLPLVAVNEAQCASLIAPYELWVGCAEGPGAA